MSNQMMMDLIQDAALIILAVTSMVNASAMHRHVKQWHVVPNTPQEGEGK